MDKLGFFMIGVSGIIFALAHSYVSISYMLIDKAQYEQFEQLEQVSD
jgi:hypothetical protein